MTGSVAQLFLYFKHPYNLFSEKKIIIEYKGVMLVFKHKLGLSFAKVRGVYISVKLKKYRKAEYVQRCVCFVVFA